MKAIVANNVHKRFKVYFDKGQSLKEKLLFQNRNHYSERWVLNGVDLVVEKGQAIGLVGENGCGKSTFLKLLTKIMYPDKGEILIKGRVSSLIELGAGFHPDMSGRENIYTNASIFGLTKSEIDSRIASIIKFSELEKFIDNPVRTYSSGMYMRLAFSVAINVDADVLLIDEILAVGDANFQRKCFDRLKELKASGVTIVIVTHDSGVIQNFCDKAVWINEGKVEIFGDSTLVVDHYLNFMEQKRLGNEAIIQLSEGTPLASDADSVTEVEEVTQLPSQDYEGNKDNEYEEPLKTAVDKLKEWQLLAIENVYLAEKGFKGKVKKLIVDVVMKLVQPQLQKQSILNAKSIEILNKTNEEIDDLYNKFIFVNEVLQEKNHLIEISKNKIQDLSNTIKYFEETLQHKSYILDNTESQIEDLYNKTKYFDQILQEKNYIIENNQTRIKELSNDVSRLIISNKYLTKQDDMEPGFCVYQVIPVLKTGDAIGNHAISLKKMLDKNQIKNAIYYNEADENAKIYGKSIELMALPKKNDLILLHMAAENSFANIIDAYECNKVMIYHNLTPSHFFENANHFAFQSMNNAVAQVERLKDKLDYCIADSQFNKDMLVAMGYTSPIEVIPVLIDFAQYTLKPSEHLISQYVDGKINILFVGRIVENKKIDDLIRIFQYYYRTENSNSRLIIVGKFEQEDEYYQRLVNSTIENKDIIFTGYVTQEELNAIYSVSDVFMTMSEHEGLCVPLIEAMNFGVPIIAYHSSAIPSTLGKSGILVNTKNEVELALLINELTKNIDKKNEIIEAQYAQLEIFRAEKIEKHYLSVITKICKGER